MKIKSTLNQRAQRICDSLRQLEDELRISVVHTESGAIVYDFGVEAEGGLRAGVHLAEICLAGLAEVKLVQGDLGPEVTVYTDHPLAACLASQYAGWQVSVDKFFAMGSGPMRAAAGREHLVQEIDFVEDAAHVVGVLESESLPTQSACLKLAADCRVGPQGLSLCVAPTTSFAGNVQVVARSVETALHKMHELGFDLRQVVSGFGSAPLPPVAADQLGGIGRTNDAILYGGRVTLWVRGDDDQLDQLVDRVPSQASRDYGVPFQEIFSRYDHDFYKIDPLLFSPATVSFVNLDSGRVFSAGVVREDLLKQSFFS